MGLLGPNFKKMEQEKDIGGLLQALRHEDWRTREIAASVLNRLNWKPENNENKAWLLAAKRDWLELAGLGEPAFAPLVLALTHSEEGVRTMAGDALEQAALSNSKIAVPYLCEALLNKTIQFLPKQINQTRDRIVEILGKTGNPNAVSALVNSISSLELKRRMITEGGSHYDHYLGHHREVVRQAIKEIGEPAIEPLIHTLTTTGAANLLSLFGHLAMNPLINSLNTKDNFKRAAIVSALGNIDDARVIENLVKVLRDNSILVRKEAAIHLRNRSWQPSNNEDKVYFLLAEILASNTYQEGELSQIKINELVAMGRTAVQPLYDSIDLEGILYRIVYMRDPNLLFRKRGFRYEYPARALIYDLLCKVGEPGEPILEKWVNDPDPMIQEFARRTMSDQIKKGTSASEPKLTGSIGTGQQQKKVSGWIPLGFGVLSLFLSLIVCISIPIIFAAGDIADDANTGFTAIACCTTPLIITGIVLSIVGLIKIIRK